VLHQWLSDLNLPGLSWWLIPAAGLVVAAVVLSLGGWLVRQRKKPDRIPVAADSFALPQSEERRSSFRRKGSAVNVDITDLARPGTLTQGPVIDRSLGGLCIEVAAPVQVGTVLNVRPSTASSIIPWTQVEVRTCRQEGDRWHLGCCFLRTPPYSILLLFG
jgi:phosphate/sulfate permease